MLLIGCGMGCSEVPDKPSHTPQVQAQQVIAWVGKYPISLQEFASRYASEGKGEPEAFLQKIIDEKLLLLEATQKSYRQKTSVQEEQRKALVHELLRKDFERWFRPSSIGLLMLRQYYRLSYNDYNQPQRAKAVHCLFLFPKEFSKKKKTPQEKARWLSEKKRIHEMAMRVLQALLRNPPQTAEAFEEIVQSWRQRLNQVEPARQAVVKELRTFLAQAQTQKASTLIPVLARSIQRLKTIPFCDPCRVGIKRLEVWTKNLLKFHKPFQAKEVKQFQREIALLSVPRASVKFEKLPAFPEFYTEGWRNMVRPFLKGVQALKNGEFSQTLTETSFGFHIIFRTAKIPPKTVSFAKAQPEIRKILYRRQRPIMFRRWLELRRKRYTIRLYPQRLKNLRK